MKRVGGMSKIGLGRATGSTEGGGCGRNPTSGTEGILALGRPLHSRFTAGDDTTWPDGVRGSGVTRGYCVGRAKRRRGWARRQRGRGDGRFADERRAGNMRKANK